MKVRNIKHKGLRRFIVDDDASGLPSELVGKLRIMVSFLQDMEDELELSSVPFWKAHQLSGARKGDWSLFVSRNWRLTFAIDSKQIEIFDLDYEDYH